MNLAEIKANPSKPWKIGTFAPAQIGDTVMATPLYQALRRHFPAAKLTLVSEMIPHPVLEGLSIFDETVLYAPDLNLAGRFDLFIHPVYCGNPAIGRHLDSYDGTISLDFLLKKKRKELRNRFDGFYSHLLFYKHQIELNMDLGRIVGIEEPLPAPYCAQGDPGRYEKWKGYIGLFVGEIGQGRQWPAEYWKQLAGYLDKVPVVFLGGPDGLHPVSEIAQQCGRPYEITFNLKDYTALCRNLKLLVVEDSGPMHMAATAGTDLVALFGKSSPVLLHPWIQPSSRCIAVASPNSCSPCDRSWSWRAAEEGLRLITCMKNILPEMVAAAVNGISPAPAGSILIQRGNRLQIKREYLQDFPRQAGWFWNYFQSWAALRGERC